MGPQAASTVAQLSAGLAALTTARPCGHRPFIVTAGPLVGLRAAQPSAPRIRRIHLIGRDDPGGKASFPVEYCTARSKAGIGFHLLRGAVLLPALFGCTDSIEKNAATQPPRRSS
jgi:hypothetical protein